MSTYHKFEPGDLLWSTVTSTPVIELASGSSGWRGNVGVSSSLSLYGGVRGRFDVYRNSPNGLEVYPLDPIDTHSIDRIIYVSGSYPSTGSIRMVKARTTALRQDQAKNLFVTSEDWYLEHTNPILRLYEYYSRFSDAYTTASYDNYCMFITGAANGGTTSPYFDTGLFPTTVATSNFTYMARIKPLNVTGPDQCLITYGDWASSADLLYITGSTGQLAFQRVGSTKITSSAAITPGVWTSVAVTLGSGSASFYINGQLDSTRPWGLSFTHQYPMTFGALNLTLFVTQLQYYPYSGYFHELRTWKRKLTAGEISSSFNSTYWNSGSDADLLNYVRFNDGPLGKNSTLAVGSGALDYATWPRPGSQAQQFYNFGLSPLAPTWQPVDDQSFVTRKTFATSSRAPSMFKVLHVPSMFYGRSIATGSIRLVCNAYRARGIERVIVDDGRGGLYVSGSMLKPRTGESYRGARWNKVGNVFYTEGFIVITDPSMLDFGETGLNSTSSFTDTLSVSFAGTYRTLTKTFHCRVPVGEANASNNKTYSYREVSKESQNYDKQVVKKVSGDTWISAVGIYNEDRRLVAVAKLAQPIRKRARDPLLIRLRFDI